MLDIFADDGADVSTANSGMEAMEILIAQQFDLIVLDLTMPKPNGWDVLEFMHKTLPHMLPRTIVLTAMRYSPEITNLLEDRHISHVFKPFEIEDLRSTACKSLLTPQHHM